MSQRLNALRESVIHLGDVASEMDPTNFTASAYPSEWTIADTFSHLGSGAVIGARGVEDYLAGRERDPGFNQSVWDQWNAKEPSDQVADALVSDVQYLDALEGMSEEQRSGYQMTLGPMSFDFDGIVGLRLGEHVLHTWDVEVPFHPGATLAADASGLILDRINFLVARTARLTGEARLITIRTIDPVRSFTLRLTADSAEMVEDQLDDGVDLALPAEALVRLVYGRLDDQHESESLRSNDVVAYLLGVFQGF
ncbi:MAG: maleylpyruvate isomerase family mycothiol-dependent enzyme [Acidimicrobiales bacterium]